MAERPYTLLSCCMSIDGYIDDAGKDRLVLSNAADFDRVDEVRASCDAILVGAGTIRADNPRLLVRSQMLADARVARGLAPSPVKVTVTEAGELDACASFFATGDAEKLVYCASACAGTVRGRLGAAATVVDAGSWWKAGAGCTPSSWPAAWRMSCSWWWHRSSWATPAHRGWLATRTSLGTMAGTPAWCRPVP